MAYMRTYGRIGQTNGVGGTWVEVQTDANGTNEQVYLTALTQYLQLGLGESPFYAGAGIPSYQSVVTQTFPDFYASRAQQYFSPYFASIAINRIPGSNPPIYQCNIVCFSGAILSLEVAT